ncbi:MAG: hypothetical protein D3M94_21820 [Rhodocyclales bacterium GT-UBC]|nr:MAG: hypothetical protein D3M94_21820 [Rhodocyclales bacterium GT-UBC]
MHYLLLIGATLWFSFLAPLKLTLATAISLAAIAALVRFLAHFLAGVTVSFWDAVKAIGNSLIFLAIAAFTLYSFSRGSGITDISGLSVLVVFCAFLATYIFAFQFTLKLAFGTSSVIALASTVASTGAFFLSRNFL